ncbi:enoyl-CoA hydratase [Pikeienuella piscinae]|uniref:enoyl-CoA hydratase n=1 Tax=Pikeienuella piscinae TaxID=2748098 RepID=A0A7M3T625_9RHOB|nr:enoyl-CoA hydratase [Pikeienuella piscinae]QIE57456.1 enoyl-CoA hydratase [Pikeienuella piscinae]
MAETVLVERKGRVATLRINRPEALNALNSAVLAEMLEKAAALDADREIGCLIVTGSEKAFAAGADIKEMNEKSNMDMFYDDFFAGWDGFAKLRTPKIAAVAGYALGGGCELAMMCDFIIAADSAKFGQPEIKLGVIPGMGGSQRLARSIGKAKAMDMVLTGRMMDAAEAERCGLVSRIVAADALMDEAMKAAEIIAGYSKPSTMVAKEAVDRAFETSLAEGLHYERRVFFGLFATHDQKEGMSAFAEKRKPDFRHE